MPSKTKKKYKVKKIYLCIGVILLSLYFLGLIIISHNNRKIINDIDYYFYNNINNDIKILLDFQTDSSLTKFVNNKVSFDDLSYIPSNLESISSSYVLDFKGNSLLRHEANLALQNLAKDFYNTFGEKLIVVSAYRSYKYQVGIKAGGCSDLFCAKAGFSEHQTGLAVDLWETSNESEFLNKAKLLKYFNWMKINAYRYGFHNTYQKGLEIDGYNREPWHWRFVGVKLAIDLYDNNQTFAEYISRIN